MGVLEPFSRKSSSQNLSLTTIEPSEEDDVLYKHYNAIYGEKPEFDAMLSETESTKLGVMEGVGLSSKERENLAAATPAGRGRGPWPSGTNKHVVFHSA